MVENGIFHCLVEERKQERQKIGGKIFSLGPPFFILPIWEENDEEKVLKDELYTNTLNLSCIFFSFFSLPWVPMWLPPPPSFFLGINIASFFSFYFLGLGRDSLFLFLIFFGTCFLFL